MLLYEARKMQPLADHIKFYETENFGHGRHEIRRYWITDQIQSIQNKNDWKDLKSVGCVESARIINGKKTIEMRYFIASIEPIVQLFARGVRSHWNVIFRADDNRMRLGHSPENFSVLQAFALNLLKREKSSKDSLRIKRHMCANNEKYLQKVLFKWRRDFSA